HFPLALGLLDQSGKELALKLTHSTHPQKQLNRGIIEMREANEEFVFGGLKSKPVLSINRNFSAPVKLEMSSSLADLSLLLASDTDEFNRYEASQNLATKMIDELVGNPSFAVSVDYLDAVGTLLNDKSIDSAFKALALELPAEEVLFQRYRPLDPTLVCSARDMLEKQIADKYAMEFLELYKELKPKDSTYNLDPKSVGNRALRNLCLKYLSLTDMHTSLVEQHFKSATNMTDEICALRLLIDIGGEP